MGYLAILGLLGFPISARIWPPGMAAIPVTDF